MTMKDYTQQLQTDFPELKIENVEVIGTGWHHVALDVNDTMIFRVPRGIHEQSDSVGYETAILKHFRGLLPVDIPNPTFIAPGKAYFGYPKLLGQPLINFYSDFSEQDKDHLREDWVNIAAVIHRGISVDEARKLKVPEFEVTIDDAKILFELDGLDKDVLDFARQTIDYIAAIDMTKENLALIHNDIQFHNLIVDPSMRRVTGLIDWTDVCVAPIAREFSAWEWNHDNQLEQVIGLYEKKTGTKVDIKQAKKWKHLEELCDLAEHINTDDDDEVKQSLDHIKKWMKAI